MHGLSKVLRMLLTFEAFNYTKSIAILFSSVSKGFWVFLGFKISATSQQSLTNDVDKYKKHLLSNAKHVSTVRALQEYFGASGR